eukprot:3540757-Rhodomonas_salina.3
MQVPDIAWGARRRVAESYVSRAKSPMSKQKGSSMPALRISVPKKRSIGSTRGTGHRIAVQASHTARA